MTMTKRKQYSLGYFNMARGMGTLMVIAGHSMALFLTGMNTGAELPVFAGAGRVLGGGIMAMFFLISGFYFKPRPVGRCIRMQAKLLKLYYATGAEIVISLVLQCFFQGRPWGELGRRLFWTYLFGFNAPKTQVILGMEVGTVSLFWFILALFLGWILYNLICRIKNVAWRRMCVCLCVVCGWILTEVSHVWPMAIPMGLIAVGYIALGFLIREKDLLERRLPAAVEICVMAVALLCLAFGHVDMSVCLWKLGLLDVVGSFCIGYLLLRVYSLYANGNPHGILARLTEYVGMHSIWIFCIHAFEKALIPWQNLRQVFPDSAVICMAVCFVGRIAVIGVLFWLLYRSRKQIRRKRQQGIVLETENGDPE